MRWWGLLNWLQKQTFFVKLTIFFFCSACSQLVREPARKDISSLLAKVPNICESPQGYVWSLLGLSKELSCFCQEH